MPSGRQWGDLPEKSPVTQLTFGTSGGREETGPTCLLHTHKERKGDTNQTCPLSLLTARTSLTVDGSAFLTLHPLLLLLTQLLKFRKTPDRPHAQIPALQERPYTLTVLRDQ